MQESVKNEYIKNAKNNLLYFLFLPFPAAISIHLFKMNQKQSAATFEDNHYKYDDILHYYEDNHGKCDENHYSHEDNHGKCDDNHHLHEDKHRKYDDHHSDKQLGIRSVITFIMITITCMMITSSCMKITTTHVMIYRYSYDDRPLPMWWYSLHMWW